MMKLTFLGAAGEVTGSQHLLETSGFRILLDCGLFQGPREASRLKNEHFRCRPADLDAVILSHGHIDHCGNLPGLYKRGFRGPIFCTAPTADIAGIMLRDSEKIQAEDARWLASHLQPGHPSVEPLYSAEDVAETVKLFRTLPLGQWQTCFDGLRLRFHEAGHILGSAICELKLRDRREECHLVFTGDLGRRGMPLLPEPATLSGCDVLICESTYANRVHRSPDELQRELRIILARAEREGGRVVIPAFSLGRTQQVLYLLKELHQRNELPPIPVYVDSPLSNRITQVYEHYQEQLSEEARETLDRGEKLFDFPRLQFITTQRESRELNHHPWPFVVISASGMCESGRVVHHLRHAVGNENSSIVIIGFQAAGTLGRQLVEKHPTVRIHDLEFPLNAQVHVLNGLSAHADADDFRWWFGELANGGGVGQAFIVHGEPESAQALSTLIENDCNEPPIIPSYGQSFDL